MEVVNLNFNSNMVQEIVEGVGKVITFDPSFYSMTNSLFNNNQSISFNKGAFEQGRKQTPFCDSNINQSLKESGAVDFMPNDMDVNLETREHFPNGSIVNKDDINNSIQLGFSRVSHAQTLKDNFDSDSTQFNYQFYKKKDESKVIKEDKVSVSKETNSKYKQNQMHCRIMTEPNTKRT